MQLNVTFSATASALLTLLSNQADKSCATIANKLIQEIAKKPKKYKELISKFDLKEGTLDNELQQRNSTKI